MNRSEFMTQLEKLLKSVPQAEREEALQYYNDYFDDAGVEHEKDVIEALGNPAKVAETIKRDLSGSDAGKDSTLQNPPTEYREKEGAGKEETSGEKLSFWTRMKKEFDEMELWLQIILIVVTVLLAPAAVGTASALVALFVGLVIAWIALIFSLAATTFALLVSMVIMIISGILIIKQAPYGALALAGTGLIIGGCGMICLMLTVALGGILTPILVRFICGLCRKVFKKKEVKA